MKPSERISNPSFWAPCLRMYERVLDILTSIESFGLPLAFLDISMLLFKISKCKSNAREIEQKLK